MSPGTEMTNGHGKSLALWYVLAGLSFIPLVGVLFGVVAIGWGLFARRRGSKRIAILGAAGICFTVLIYGGLFYFGAVQRGGLYDELRTKMAQGDLNILVKSVEFYKQTHGEYPASLEELKSSLPAGSQDSLATIDPRIIKSSQGDRLFYYRRVDAEHYYLRGIAPDGKPFSPGALVPQVGGPSSRLGLLIEPPQ
jgi:hypothetical protein